jgi:hypothetical protein
MVWPHQILSEWVDVWRIDGLLSHKHCRLLRSLGGSALGLAHRQHQKVYPLAA